MRQSWLPWTLGRITQWDPPRLAPTSPLSIRMRQSKEDITAQRMTTIKNSGQRVITGKNEHGNAVSMPIQVAEVNKVLGPVREMVNAGNRVVFDKDLNG
eukprot:290023-Pyramimonas_sp.AAC.1